jgi:AraC-like DNA-binding protein
LFAVPAETLVDQHYEACAVVGSTVSRLRDQLAGTKSFLERVRVTDNFLLSLCPSRKPVDDIAAAARRLLLTGGCARVSDMARATGLSPRQFERRFRTYVGVPPKLYARIARFEAALNLKAVSRLNTWTEIAHQLGYYDQMHMVHDFQQFSGDVPTRIASQLAMFVDGPTQIGECLHEVGDRFSAP